MADNNLFLSCDWGTTSFRLRLVAANDFRVIASQESKSGIAGVYDQWCREGKDEARRLDFFTSVLDEQLRALKAKTDFPDDIPLLISGMASSNIGMMELPYKQLPFALDGSDLLTKILPPSTKISNPIMLISGVRSDDDVMRGEEVQVIGCGIQHAADEVIIIHPGTHSKHIFLKGDSAVAFTTYMTGECFSLLSTRSILASSIESSGDFENYRKAFEEGVQAAQTQNLLHTSFLVRTASLFKKRSPQENHFYLSGLLIGYELTDFPQTFKGAVLLAGEPALSAQYEAAFECLALRPQLDNLIVKRPDAITLAGQYAVYKNSLKQ